MTCKLPFSSFLVIAVVFSAQSVLSAVAFAQQEVKQEAKPADVQPDREGIAFFEQKIRPLLAQHCYECHSQHATKLRGNLLLDSEPGWQRGGDSGQPAIVPGDAEASLLLRTVQHLEDGLEMPPDRPKLPDSAISDLTTWIKLGAPDPRDGSTNEVKRADKDWWSLQPLRKQFQHQSIDDFIDDQLARVGLVRNPPADVRTLVRRITYDLTGLPPTIEESTQFVQRHSANSELAVAELVDRLLASPRYGERWGRHWLDVVRFGESIGFERNVIIDDLHPFRDYVIKSLNDDKPFDQFIIEHLAGDVIGQNQPEVEVGSAFIVAGPYDDVGNQDPVAQANIRAATLDDMITATSSAFLGLTINCARCHHHKFDPIPTEDYYRLRTAFEGVKHDRRVIATNEDREKHKALTDPLNQQLKALEAQRTKIDEAIDERAKVVLAEMKFTRPKIDVHGTYEEFPPVEAKQLKFVMLGQTSGEARPPQNGIGAKLTEFEVWSASEPARNIALATYGTVAEGAKSAFAEDFPEAYGPHYCIDGTRGEAWFIGKPSVLTLTFAKPEVINKISFSNSRGERDTDESKVRGTTPSEYEVQVSSDGQTWTTVATSAGREPWSQAHGIALARQQIQNLEDQAALEAVEKQIADIRDQLAKIPPLPLVFAGKFANSNVKTQVHVGGDPTKLGDEVVASSLNVLDQVASPYELPADAPEADRRLALGKWIVSSDNPLTPRVLANRVWQYHFGTGIVDTPSDFGYLGSTPTHPELLDYLATRLIDGGWKLKNLHREIVTSQAYLQSSAYREQAASIDKSSRLLWRFPPRRLSAEEIRDSILAVTGNLRLEPMGGPGFRLYKFTQNNVCTYFPLDKVGPETYRRSVYHQNARASVVDFLSDFDLPDIAFAAPRRANTTTPLQSLTMMNHSFMNDMAASLALRLDEEDKVQQVFLIVHQRAPDKDEYASAKVLLDTHGPIALCRALLNTNELIYVE